MTIAVLPGLGGDAGTRAAHPVPVGAAGTSAGERIRWRMGVEARALTLVTAVLVVFGLATLFSASVMDAMDRGFGATFYFRRQGTGVLAGIIAFALAAKWDAERWRRVAWPFMLACLAVMLAVLVLPESLAPTTNGSRRFLVGRSIQPSEFAKLAVVTWTAMLAVKKGDDLKRLGRGLLPFAVVIVALDLLAWLEPDISAALMYTLLCGVLLYAAGAKVGHFLALGLCAVPLVFYKADRLAYIARRLASFVDPSSAPAQVGYQLKQSLIAIGSGGLFGVGFGNGQQQKGYLPLAYNDFIGGIIGEEWGFVGMVALVALYAAYGWLGFRIARKARSPFTGLVALGLTVTMVVTAYLHIGVVIGLLPTTGLTLPFISYGRSNLVLSLFMTGILVNIGSERERVLGGHATDPMTAGPR
jgi:cell division protein FtsW